MDADLIPQLAVSWRKTLACWTVAPEASERCLQMLLHEFGQPQRHYHNLRHIAHMLAVLEEFGEQATDLPAVQLATWFHDAVYSSEAKDNEERSAALASSALVECGVPELTRRRVSQLILSTKTHSLYGPDDDGALFLDADLAILATAPAVYDWYAAAIRLEYDWVGDDAYRAGRTEVLQAFLKRPQIYQTETLRNAWEKSARCNLEREIASMRIAMP